MARRTLRAVTADEAPPTPKSITEAASTGDQRALLVGMRDRLAKAVEDERTAPRDLASLTKRLMEVAHDIEAFDAREQEEAHGAASVPDAAFDASAV